MVHKNVFQHAGGFASALVSDPKETVKTSWRGLREGFSNLEGPDKFFAPFFLGVGGLMAGAGVANLNPVSVLCGAFNMAVAGNMYLEAGRELPPPAPPKLPDPA